MPIFFSLKGSTVLIKIMKYKMGFTVLILQYSCRKCAPNAFPPIFLACFLINCKMLVTRYTITKGSIG